MEDRAPFCPNCGAQNQQAAPRSGEFCAVCGERLREGEAFCPNCGAAVQVREGKPAKNTHRNKIIGISAAVVAVVVVAAVLAVIFLPGVVRSDAENFVYYQQQLFVDPIMDSVTTGINGAMGALNADFTLSLDVDDPALGALLNGSSVGLKVKTQEGRVVINADVNFLGSQLLTAAAYYEDGVLGVYLPQAKDVIYTMDVSDYVDLSHFLTDLDAQELNRCVQRYLDILFAVVDGDNLTVEKNKTAPYAALEGEFKGTLYTFVPTAQDIRGALEELADTLEGDEYLAQVLDTALSGSGEKSGRELLAQAADELRYRAREAGETVENSGFQWSLGMEGKTVRQILITANGSGFGYETSGDAESRDGESFRFFTFTDGGDPVTLISGGRTQEGQRLSGHMEIAGMVFVQYDCDQESVSPLGLPCGSYQVSLSGIGEPMTLKFEVKKAQDGSFDHTFSLEGVALNINVTEGSSATMPNAPTQDISDYSPEELEELFYDLGYALGQDLGLDLEGILGNFSGGFGYGF